MLTIQTILHPTDLSPRSEYAFHLACALARDHGGSVVVLHVYPPPVAHGEVVARRQDDYEEQLRQHLHRIQAPGLTVCVRHRLAEGAPAEEILRVAGELGCDLIAMGTHGRTGLGRLLMGSVAEEVVRKAPCPVLTVKTPFAETQPSMERIAQTAGTAVQPTKA